MWCRCRLRCLHLTSFSAPRSAFPDYRIQNKRPKNRIHSRNIQHTIDDNSWNALPAFFSPPPPRPESNYQSLLSIQAAARRTVQVRLWLNVDISALSLWIEATEVQGRELSMPVNSAELHISLRRKKVLWSQATSYWPHETTALLPNQLEGVVEVGKTPQTSISIEPATTQSWKKHVITEIPDAIFQQHPKALSLWSRELRTVSVQICWPLSWPTTGGCWIAHTVFIFRKINRHSISLKAFCL